MNEIIEQNDVYRNLQKHLDKMPVGYPPTESGVDLRLLKHLFDPEEAELALKLSFMPEPLEKIYGKVKKSGITIEDLEFKLDEMYNKGLINYGKKSDGDKTIKYYANAPLIIGMFEYQLKRLTKDFIKDFKDYLDEAFWEEYNKPKVPQLRTIPIEQSISHEQTIATYDDLRSIIQNCGEPIGIAECICRKSKDLLGEPCEKTDLREVCFTFRTAAESYIERGFARSITKEEALEILEKVEEAGLVLQPGNSQRPMCICCCCGCCCEILTHQKKLSEPALFFATNFVAEVDDELCVGCEVCVNRCNMEAISIIDNKSKVNQLRCIGCGACVLTCTSEAISIKKKDEVIIPPKNTTDTYMEIMKAKHRLSKTKKN